MADQMDQEYLAKRQLKRGTAGWLLLAGLGVSYVISGDFIAAVLMGLMYLT
ncbi:MAG: ethanolamine permease, partial [Marinomonas sp.]